VNNINRYPFDYRMSGNKERERTENIREIQKNIELVGASSVKVKAQIAKVTEKIQQNTDMETS
jgi:large subunit ribosomal protein L24e